MSSQNTLNPLCRCSGACSCGTHTMLIERLIGNAYEVVKYVACNMCAIKAVAEFLSRQVVDTVFNTTINLDFSVYGVTRRITLAADCTVTFTGAKAGQECTLIVVQDWAGGHNITDWGTNVSGEPLLPSGALPNTATIFRFVFDGTNYLLLNSPIGNQ